MQKWEYKAIRLDVGFENLLNELGMNGWELTSIFNWIAYFKRPIQIREKPNSEMDMVDCISTTTIPEVGEMLSFKKKIVFRHKNYVVVNE